MSKYDIAISAQGLGKMYKIYSNPRDLALELVTNKKRHKEKWVLEDISFDVKKGSVVGIIGENGAGKSTLLKIISGTLEKTIGSYNVNGKISAILELGTGFHPRYSGRENIIMGGMCYGMSLEEVESKVDWIIEFSELEDVIDQPFHTYSSGMQARLTFATAISVDPDLLIIDEALAAGDAYFVSKCMQRIHEICNSGATVFFVSHSLYLIIELCDHAIWIDEGRIRSQGDAYAVAKAYEKTILEATNKKHFDVAEKQLSIESEKQNINAPILGEREPTYILDDNSSLKIHYVSMYGLDGKERYVFKTGETVNIRVDWKGKTDKTNIVPGLRIDALNQQAITGYDGSEEKSFLNQGSVLDGKGAFEFSFKSLDLGMGNYFISVSLAEHNLVSSNENIIYAADRILEFSIVRTKMNPLTYIYEPSISFQELS